MWGFLATGSFESNPKGLVVGIISIAAVSLILSGIVSKTALCLSSLPFNAATTWLRALLHGSLALAHELNVMTIASLNWNLTSKNSFKVSFCPASPQLVLTLSRLLLLVESLPLVTVS